MNTQQLMVFYGVSDQPLGPFTAEQWASMDESEKLIQAAAIKMRFPIESLRKWPVMITEYCEGHINFRDPKKAAASPTTSGTAPEPAPIDSGVQEIPATSPLVKPATRAGLRTLILDLARPLPFDRPQDAFIDSIARELSDAGWTQEMVRLTREYAPRTKAIMEQANYGKGISIFLFLEAAAHPDILRGRLLSVQEAKEYAAEFSMSVAEVASRVTVRGRKDDAGRPLIYYRLR